MGLLAFSILAVVTIRFSFAKDCKAGEVWIEGKFKMECYTNGYYTGYNPIACVPSGNISGPLYYPGQSWTDGNFKYQCYQTETQGLGYNIIACITPTKQEIPTGSSLAVPGTGIYRCTKRDDGMVFREVDSGCVQNGKLYAYGTSWTVNNIKYTCSYANDAYVITSTTATPTQAPQPKPQPQPQVTAKATAQPQATAKPQPQATAQPQPQPAPVCKAGAVWIQNKFKMECYTNGYYTGYQPIACVPSGKLDGPVYYPGQTWIEGSFKYRCEQTGNQGMTYNIVACLTSTNQEVAVGSTLAVPSKGIYECTRKQDGTVFNNVKAGCVRNNALVAYSTTWTEGSTQLMCVWANEKYEIKATACLTPEKVVVNVNTYKVIKEKYYKCVLNQQDATKAEFIEVKRSG